MDEQETEHRRVQETAETAAVAATQATWPQTRALLRLIFVVLAVAGVMWALYILKGVILLVILAIFFAYLIAPLVEIIRRPFSLKGREYAIPRSLAIGIVYVIIFGSLGIALYFLLPHLGNQITNLAKQAPTYLANAKGRAQALNQLYRRLQLPPSAMEAANNAAMRLIETISEYAQAGLSSLVGFIISYIPWLVLIPILAFFLLKDVESFRRSALLMLPKGRLRWRGDEFFQDVNSTLAAYIRAQLTACLLIGILCSMGFALIGVPYALVFGTVAGLLEFIPLAGPLMMAIVVILVASFHGGVAQAVEVFLFLAALRILQDYVIYPRIIGQGIHLHPLAVILAILCGAEMAGIAGIFLAIPVVAIISVTHRHWLEHKGSEEGLVAQLLKPAEPEAPLLPEESGPQTPIVNPPRTAVTPNLETDG